MITIKNASEHNLKNQSVAIPINALTVVTGVSGSGKSSLSNALMGHPSYEITKGEAFINGQNIKEMAADERSRAGLFLAFQTEN